MSKHTEGPWDLSYTPETKFYISADGPIVSGIEKEADAVLMVSAPELLVSLTEVLEIVEKYELQKYSNQLTEANRKAKLAIAKAKGEL